MSDKSTWWIVKIQYGIFVINLLLCIHKVPNKKKELSNEMNYLNIGNHWSENKDLLFNSNLWMWHHHRHRASPPSRCVCVCVCVCVCISPFWVSWSLLPLPVAVRRTCLWVLVSPHPEPTFAAVFLSLCVSADTHRCTHSVMCCTRAHMDAEGGVCCFLCYQ